MSATVEKMTKTDENIPFFPIKLNGPDTFDLDLFDRQVKELVEGPSNHKRESTVKFVVVDGIMPVFTASESHAAMYSRLLEEPDTAMTYSGKLVCAGTISLSKGEPPIRYILCGSDSLAQSGELHPKALNEFKDYVLKDALGDYFAIN
ncbi:MAG TPA: hypothetical protein VH234_06095 [Candidatus Saccharimonadales bacterium]|jgi:hypothetical protein|nr:hypothetical protein [Candidatus Saccharimonadales bacterium]